MSEVFIGDTVTIDLATTLVLTGYTLKILYRKPDGTVGSWDATISSTDSTHLYYTTLDSDFDQEGIWLLQSYIDYGGIYLHGQWVELKVLTPLIEL
jgi:hypothetical protein